MLLVAGITASVIIQTMSSLQEQALQTGMETIKEVSSGIRVTHVSGYNDGTSITQLAIFIQTIAASEDIDLAHTYISLSDSTNQVVLNYNSSVFSSSVTTGLFSTLTASNINADEYGLIVIRDVDSSCAALTPIINDADLVVMILNTTASFSGIGTRKEVFGEVTPEFGIGGIISFATPSAYINTINDLQP